MTSNVVTTEKYESSKLEHQNSYSKEYSKITDPILE